MVKSATKPFPFSPDLHAPRCSHGRDWQRKAYAANAAQDNTGQSGLMLLNTGSLSYLSCSLTLCYTKRHGCTQTGQFACSALRGTAKCLCSVLLWGAGVSLGVQDQEQLLSRQLKTELTVYLPCMWNYTKALTGGSLSCIFALNLLLPPHHFLLCNRSKVSISWLHIIKIAFVIHMKCMLYKHNTYEMYDV